MKQIPFYDDPSFNYKNYWRERKYENKTDQLALKRFLKLVPKKNNLIDIGAGFGRLTPVYRSQFKKCVLLDPSTKMLNEAKVRFKEKNIEFVKAYVEKLPFKDKIFDVAIFIRIIHHLKKPPVAIKEAARVLKPGGYFILEFANKLHLKAKIRAILRLNFKFFSDLTPTKVGHTKPKTVPFLNYHPESIKMMLTKNGFEIIKILSVSNFRNSLCKKILPLKILLFLEKISQEIYSPFHAGPSIFILARKR